MGMFQCLHHKTVSAINPFKKRQGDIIFQDCAPYIDVNVNTNFTKYFVYLFRKQRTP